MRLISLFMMYLIPLLFHLGIYSQIVQKIDAIAAQKIIALSTHSVEMLFAIGAGERIVGTVEYADYPEAALSIPRIGNYTGIQIEKVVALQPDLIIVWKSGNKSSDIEKLKSLGFRLVYSNPQNINEMAAELIRLGELTDLQENAKIAAHKIVADYEEIKSRYYKKDKVTVFYQLWYEPLRTLGPDNWIQSLINDCNGSNLFDDANTPYPVVSLENVLLKNPEVIIIPSHSGSSDINKKFWQKWQNIAAVKQHRIFTINGDLLHRFGPRAIAGLERLCQAIDRGRAE